MKTFVNTEVSMSDEDNQFDGRMLARNTPCNILSETSDDKYASGTSVTIICNVITDEHTNTIEEQTVVIDKSFITYGDE